MGYPEEGHQDMWKNIGKHHVLSVFLGFLILGCTHNKSSMFTGFTWIYHYKPSHLWNILAFLIHLRSQLSCYSVGGASIAAAPKSLWPMSAGHPYLPWIVASLWRLGKDVELRVFLLFLARKKSITYIVQTILIFFDHIVWEWCVDKVTNMGGMTPMTNTILVLGFFWDPFYRLCACHLGYLKDQRCKKYPYGGFHHTSIAGWFLMENPINIWGSMQSFWMTAALWNDECKTDLSWVDDLGVPPF